MSHRYEAATSGPHAPSPERERIPWLALAAVALVAMGIFAVGGLWAAYILERRTGGIDNPPGGPLPPQLGEVESGIVDLKLFEESDRAERMRAEQLELLESYGWVDRQRGVIRVPVAEAMALMARGRRPTAPATDGGHRHGP